MNPASTKKYRPLFASQDDGFGDVPLGWEWLFFRCHGRSSTLLCASCLEATCSSQWSTDFWLRSLALPSAREFRKAVAAAKVREGWVVARSWRREDGNEVCDGVLVDVVLWQLWVQHLDTAGARIATRRRAPFIALHVLCPRQRLAHGFSGVDFMGGNAQPKFYS